MFPVFLMLPCLNRKKQTNKQTKNQPNTKISVSQNNPPPPPPAKFHATRYVAWLPCKITIRRISRNRLFEITSPG